MLPANQLPPPSAAETLDLLAGTRVLDLTTSVAGPYATLLLADLGATVAKVERPVRGDDTRAWGPPFLDGESLWFLSVNRNKHSITLDYSNPEGLAVLHALVEKADIVVTNQVEKNQKKLGIDYATLSAINPQLIHVSITGFGLTGEKKNDACYDLIAEGYSSVMDLTGELENDPQKIGTPAADMLSGEDAALGALAALVQRHRTGRGQAIDISMVESMTRFMSPRIVPYLGSGTVPRRSGAKDSVIAIYQVFDTADHPITLGLGNDGIWQRFCQAVGRDDLAQDPRLANNVGRREHRAYLVKEIQSVLMNKPRSHWLPLFSASRIPAGPINRVDQVVQEPFLLERGLFYQAQRDQSPIPQVGLGIAFDGNNHTYRKAPPRLGEDTSAVLSDWLGYQQEQVDALAAKGVL